MMLRWVLYQGLHIITPTKNKTENMLRQKLFHFFESIPILMIYLLTFSIPYFTIRKTIKSVDLAKETQENLFGELRSLTSS